MPELFKDQIDAGVKYFLELENRVGRFPAWGIPKLYDLMRELEIPYDAPGYDDETP